MITQDELKKFLKYNPDTGVFTWIVYTGGNIKKGAIAGSRRPNGYIDIRINRTGYLAHRLAWLYMNGEFPKKEIDHINRNKSDNSFCNLREASSSQNHFNREKQKNNTSGFKGVTPKDNGYQAQATFKGKHIHLGWFKTPEEASKVYQKFIKENHGEFCCVG